MAFFRFTAKTDHTATHGKRVTIFDSLVSISVFFVRLSMEKLIQNATNTSNEKL